MGFAVYVLGVVVTLACSILLLRAYFRARQKLLFWSGLCFLGLAVSNFLVLVDLALIGPEISLYRWRLISAAIAMGLLVFGLVWEGE